MSGSIEQPQTLNERLATLLATMPTALAREWVATPVFPREGMQTHTREHVQAQAERFLRLLAHSLGNSDPATANLYDVDVALQGEFPLVYRISAQLALATLLAERVQQPADLVLAQLQRALASYPIPDERDRLFNERLGRLNQLSWMLNIQRDEDSIISLTLTEASALVGAVSSAIWLWDADQQAPVMMVTAPKQAVACQPPSPLLQFLRHTCESGCAFSIDAGESDESWPDELQQCPIAFIPLPSPEGCLGILTVHHTPDGAFSHDDILLLSSLGNLAASALRNVQLYTNERHLVKLLQTSIRQVGEATANRSDQHDEFVHSLLHVAEGLTRADAVCAILTVEDDQPPLVAVSGPLATDHREALAETSRQILAQYARKAIPSAGLLSDIFPRAGARPLRTCYALADVLLGGKSGGIVIALSDVPFAEDQIAFLRTMAEQIGVGVDNRQQSANLQRLLFELSNVNYVSEVITSTFDPHRIFSTISQAASQALRAPIVLCGWLEADGSIRVLPDTTVGIPADLTANLSLTYNNTVIRTVLEQQSDVSSRTLGKRAQSAFPTLGQLQIRDWICVPMMVKPRARGVMLVADVHSRAFTNREIALLSTYANQAALAMENSLLYEQVDHQLQQMEQLYQVTRSIGASLQLDAVLQELMHAATTALKVPVALVCLRDDDSGIQQIVAASGMDVLPLMGSRIEPGEGILGLVGQRGEVVASSNLLRDGRSQILRDLAREEGLASSLTVPLQVQGRVLGTLTVISREAREYTAAHEQLVLAMATEAAVAVQNARLYEQERERAYALRQLIGEVSARMTTTLELLHELLEVAARTEPTPEGMTRTCLRLESIAAVQKGIADDDPAMVDMKEAITWLATARSMRYAKDDRHLLIHVTGAHLVLPSRYATALALLIHEWMQAATEQMAGCTEGKVAIAFQQFGREVLVHVEDSADWQGAQASVNHAIITLVTRILPGTVTETCEGGMHRVRFRFHRPS